MPSALMRVNFVYCSRIVRPYAAPRAAGAHPPVIARTDFLIFAGAYLPHDFQLVMRHVRQLVCNDNGVNDRRTIDGKGPR